MARVKRAVNAHKKRRVVLERASGYRGQRSRLYRKAKEQLLHSLLTTSAIVRLARATSASCGSSASMLLSALRASPTTASSRACTSLASNWIVALSPSWPSLIRRPSRTIVEQAKAALPADVNAPKEA